MSALFNESQTPWLVMEALTNNITGSLFLSLILIYVLVIGLSMLFRMEIEYTMLFLLPLTIVLMAFSGEFLAFGFVMLLYMGFILAKNFFIK